MWQEKYTCMFHFQGLKCWHYVTCSCWGWLHLGSAWALVDPYSVWIYRHRSFIVNMFVFCCKLFHTKDWGVLVACFGVSVEAIWGTTVFYLHLSTNPGRCHLPFPLSSICSFFIWLLQLHSPCTLFCLLFSSTRAPPHFFSSHSTFRHIGCEQTCKLVLHIKPPLSVFFHMAHPYST